MALVKEEQRICFGLRWYDSEQEAIAYGEEVRKQGITYNGGWFHGRPCGRDPSWDYTDETGRRLYAVTD